MAGQPNMLDVRQADPWVLPVRLEWQCRVCRPHGRHHTALRELPQVFEPRQSTPLSHGAYLCPICCSDVVNRQTAAAIVSYIRRAYIKAGLGEIKNWRLKVTDLDTMYNRHGNISGRGELATSCRIYGSSTITWTPSRHCARASATWAAITCSST